MITKFPNTSYLFFSYSFLPSHLSLWTDTRFHTAPLRQWRHSTALQGIQLNEQLHSVIPALLAERRHGGLAAARDKLNCTSCELYEFYLLV